MTPCKTEKRGENVQAMEKQELEIFKYYCVQIMKRIKSRSMFDMERIRIYSKFINRVNKEMDERRKSLGKK